MTVVITILPEICAKIEQVITTIITAAGAGGFLTLFGTVHSVCVAVF